MAEDSEGDRARGSPAPLAEQLALVGSGDEARDYLKKQSRLADLQIEYLAAQDEYELSHLRWRRFNDQMRGALQIMLVAVGALIVVAIGAAVWNASQASGLVVDAFTAPPDFEQRGMGGDVIAGDMTDRIAAVRAIGAGVSYSTSNDVSKDGTKDIKVEIPETGVSISEAWRYLRSWLGHERHLTGSLREIGGGRIALAVSLDGGDPIVETGSPSELGELEQKAAEDAFGEFDPVNHINYLAEKNRYRETYDAAARFVQIAQGRLMRADSYGLYSYSTAYATGDLELAIARTRVGLEIDPNVAVLRVMATRFYRNLGRDEEVLHEARAVLVLRSEDQPPAHRGRGFADIQKQARGAIALFTGDYANADGWFCTSPCDLRRQLLTRAALAARQHDVSGSRSKIAEAYAVGPVDPSAVAAARYFVDMETADWAAAIADGTSARADMLTTDNDLSQRYIDISASTTYNPLLAVAEAHAGQFAAAHRDIDATLPGCVPCETVRGDIDALEKKPDAAAWWYARAIHDAPSIPFAYADWGAMLLAQGDLNGAIAKFESAHVKGPYFADPLEMWGEALVRESRSDLALAKFSEAAKYAPNWGRLHLKWGEALLWSGKPDDAQKQFAIAASLDLSTSEKSELARVKGPHG